MFSTSYLAKENQLGYCLCTLEFALTVLLQDPCVIDIEKEQENSRPSLDSEKTKNSSQQQQQYQEVITVGS